MGHIVFPAPGFDRFHVIDRLTRELATRGHRLTILCLDPVARTFWSTQGLPTVYVPPGRPIATRAPLEEFAAIDCKRRRLRPTGRRLEVARRRLAVLLPGLLRWFESDPPDLVCLHQRRTGANRMVHFLARECGARVLWTGTGLLPQTVQLDEEGLDGEARTSRRTAWDFRALPANDDLLAASLAAVVGRTAPSPLARRAIQVPPLWSRLLDAVAAGGRDPGAGRMHALRGWLEALPPPTAPLPRHMDLPNRPFVAVLLQREDDDRLLLDAVAPPDPAMLVRAVRSAARGLDRDMPVVVVLPPDGLRVRELAPLRRLAGVQLETAPAAIETSIAATAIVTVNDGMAGTGLLAGTPVVHLGSALYGIPGVATRARLDTLAHDLDRAVTDDQPELRKRYLSWMFAHGHVWCSVEHPDHNGINGLVLAMERRLEARGPHASALSYRIGPAWPLAAEGQR